MKNDKAGTSISNQRFLLNHLIFALSVLIVYPHLFSSLQSSFISSLFSPTARILKEGEVILFEIIRTDPGFNRLHDSEFHQSSLEGQVEVMPSSLASGCKSDATLVPAVSSSLDGKGWFRKHCFPSHLVPYSLPNFFYFYSLVSKWNLNEALR